MDCLLEHFNYNDPLPCSMVSKTEKSIKVKVHNYGSSKSIQVGDSVISYYDKNILIGNVINNNFPLPGVIELVMSPLQFHYFKRQHPLRLPISMAAAICKSTVNEYDFASAKDISYTGIRVNCINECYFIDEEVEINLTLRNKECISFSGIIANKNKVYENIYEYGINITAMASKERESYDDLIRELVKKFSIQGGLGS